MRSLESALAGVWAVAADPVAIRVPTSITRMNEAVIENLQIRDEGKRSQCGQRQQYPGSGQDPPPHCSFFTQVWPFLQEASHSFFLSAAKKPKSWQEPPASAIAWSASRSRS